MTTIIERLRENYRTAVRLADSTADLITELTGEAPTATAAPTPAKVSTRDATIGTRTRPAGTNGHKAPKVPPAPTTSLSDRVLVLAPGKTPKELAAAVADVRPNHVGIAAKRHVKAGRLTERDGRYYAAETRAAA